MTPPIVPPSEANYQFWGGGGGECRIAPRPVLLFSITSIGVIVIITIISSIITIISIIVVIVVVIVIIIGPVPLAHLE